MTSYNHIRTPSPSTGLMDCGFAIDASGGADLRPSGAGFGATARNCAALLGPHMAGRWAQTAGDETTKLQRLQRV